MTKDDLINHIFNHNAAETFPIPPKTILLEEGKIADRIYLVRKGCLRLFFYSEGKDITFQFFFEGDFVASFDSLYKETPSLFSLESIEPSEVLYIKKRDFYDKIESNSSLRKLYEEKIIERFSFYQHLFLSRIKNTPQQRYEELLKEYPNIIQRVPQHYIASYLGITPVSLSRIRNRRYKVVTFAPLNLEMYEKNFCNRLDFNRCIHRVSHFRSWSAHSRTWEQPRSMA